MLKNQKEKSPVGVKKLYPDSKLPVYAKIGDSCADVCAYIKPYKTIDIAPGERMLIKTGIALEIPIGYEVQVRARSGLALNRGLTVLNGIGTIDNGFSGELGVIIINTSKSWQTILHDERIAQIAVVPIEQFEFIEVDELTSTERGENGFGSTGT